MADDPNKPPDDEPFDAIAAAAELEQALSESAAGGAPDRYVGMLEEEVAALTAELSREKAATAAAQTRAERAFAEIEQTRVRIERDAERRSQQRGRDLLVGFLEVLDDADRAVAAIRSSDASRNLLTGVEALQRRLEQALGAQGIQRQLALGVRFDPSLHEAISVQPVPDAERDGLILSVAREGYVLGDEVLRPARVVVGKRSR